jgi:YHS domain-containing protein
MPTWLFLLIIGLLFFLLMRAGCGSHVTGHRRGGQDKLHGHEEGVPRLEAPKTAVDPVCGMSIETASAKSALHAGQAYYFCSAQCRDKFEAAPQSFLKPGKEGAQPMEHRHG